MSKKMTSKEAKQKREAEELVARGEAIWKALNDGIKDAQKRSDEMAKAIAKLKRK